eukprot:GHUV01029208.1.p1 GENE.GHUV01029208.1~~GHUV01029208.1.p1  ORF type:complete len:326 (+),score=37.08 GHUV01029208.1:124-1101(+)
MHVLCVQPYGIFTTIFIHITSMGSSLIAVVSFHPDPLKSFFQGFAGSQPRLESKPCLIDQHSRNLRRVGVLLIGVLLMLSQDAGQPVTTTLMNIICRAIARLGNTEAAGTVLQSYGVWGIAHDADSYNAIMECCKINAKVVGAESLLSYMTSKGIKPNAATWNLLISTAIAAGDRGAVVSAIERTMAANCKVQVAVVKRAKELAHDEPPSRPALRLALNRVIEQQNLQDELRMPVNVNYHQRQQQYQLGQARESSSGVGEFRRQTKDVWRPGMQQPEEQPEQQQVKQPPVQQPQQPSEDEHSGSDEQPQMSGLRSQLRDAFKPGR